MKNKYIEEIFNSDNTYYAHTKKSSSKELLYAHMELTYKYYLEMEKYKNLQNIVYNILDNLYNDISEKSKEKIYDLFKSSIFYHDIGKINPIFQAKKMNNYGLNDDGVFTSEHAIFSSAIYLDASLKDILDNKDKYNSKEIKIIIYMLYTFSYVISRHHTGLNNPDEFIPKLISERLKKLYKNNISDNMMINIYKIDQFNNYFKSIKVDEISTYILNKLLFSVMISSDYFSTYEYESSKKVEFEIERNEDLFNKYEDSQLYKSIRYYQKNPSSVNGINKLRNDMFIESENKLIKNIDKNIFYLEAPTGSGKTNMAINLCRNIYKTKKEYLSINYIFPFNTLVEQTSQTFENYFTREKDFFVINSLNPIVSDVNDDLDYEAAYLQNAFSKYKIKITSHVNLFETFFGISKSSNYQLFNYVNSIIVIDEIQAYNNDIWRKMALMFDRYAKLLNIKFIIMSATLPNLDIFIDSNASNNYCNLLTNSQKYYNNPLFKDRVKLDFSLLNKDITLNMLKDKVLKYKGKKILVEFIKKQTAREFYKILRKEELCDTDLYEITGDDNNCERKNVINKIKEEKSMIVVSTQTIEAGVDIDMDIGFKDISLVESEEQFLGRINRSCKKDECIAYFFDYDNQNQIYKDDNRLEFNILNEKYRKLLLDKNFKDYYFDVLNKIKRETEKNNSNNIEGFKNECLNIKYKDISNELKLIKNNYIQIFLNTNINIDGQVIIGKEVWQKYIKLCEDRDMDFYKKSILLSEIRPKINMFIYNIYSNKNSKPNYYDQEFSNIFYIDNGDKFIDNGKFDRKKYVEYTGGYFL